MPAELSTIQRAPDAATAGRGRGCAGTGKFLRNSPILRSRCMRRWFTRPARARCGSLGFLRHDRDLSGISCIHRRLRKCARGTRAEIRQAHHRGDADLAASRHRLLCSEQAWRGAGVRPSAVDRARNRALPRRDRGADRPHSRRPLRPLRVGPPAGAARRPDPRPHPRLPVAGEKPWVLAHQTAPHPRSAGRSARAVVGSAHARAAARGAARAGNHA